MGLSFWQLLLVVVLLMLLFGRGKIPALMSDIAAGIKGFKKEMHDEDKQNPIADAAKAIEEKPATDKPLNEKVGSDMTTGQRS